MTPANRIKLEKASRELADLARAKKDAQATTLDLYPTLDLIFKVLEDLAWRPDVNSEEK